MVSGYSALTSQSKEAKMGKHLRKLFSEREVKEIFERYLSREVGTGQALALLKIRRRQFFKLLKAYREFPNSFSLDYKRKIPPRQLDEKAEKKIVSELEKEARLIEDKNNPIKNYNYSFIRETLEQKHDVRVSLSTIIDRAKKGGFIRKRNSESRMTGKS